MATKLDSLDYKILKMLSLNARKPYLEIARACNVSGAAIHQRIQKLYNMDVIKGSISRSIPHRWDIRPVPTLVSSSTTRQSLTRWWQGSKRSPRW